MCWMMLKWDRIFQVLGNQGGGGAQQSPGLRYDMLNGSAESTSSVKEVETLHRNLQLVLRWIKEGSGRRAGNSQLPKRMQVNL